MFLSKCNEALSASGNCSLKLHIAVWFVCTYGAASVRGGHIVLPYGLCSQRLSYVPRPVLEVLTAQFGHVSLMIFHYVCGVFYGQAAPLE